MLCCECAYWGGWSLLCDDTRAPLRRTLLALGGRDTVVLFACTLRDADRELGLVRALQDEDGWLCRCVLLSLRWSALLTCVPTASHPAELRSRPRLRATCCSSYSRAQSARDSAVAAGVRARRYARAVSQSSLALPKRSSTSPGMHASARAAPCPPRAVRCVRLQARAHAACCRRVACSAADAESLFAAVWAQAGAQPQTPPVRLESTPLGRGLVVRGAPLDAGALIVSLPWTSVIAVTDGETKDGPADARLARALLAATAPGGDNALWQLYSGLLPRSTGAAALWSASAVDELQAARAVESAHGARLHFRAHAARMSGVSESAALHAFSLVHSRSFAIEVPGRGRLRLLAPLADLINNEQLSAAEVAGGDDDAAWSRSNNGRFELRAPRRFEVGEEMLMFYGHESSAELLISYGFAPEPNPADYLPLYADLRELLDDDRWVPREPRPVARAKAAQLYAGDAAQAPLAVRPGGVAAAAHLLGCLRVLHADAADLSELEERHDDAVGHSTWQWCGLPADDDAAARRARTEAAALQQAAARAQEVLVDMPTTLAEDEALLRDALCGDPDDDGAALIAALRFRMGVKRMLAQFAADAAAS